MRCYRAPLGTEVIREGDDGDFMVLLLEGSVEIVKKDRRAAIAADHGLARVRARRSAKCR
jgi:hypothetical protein